MLRPSSDWSGERGAAYPSLAASATESDRSECGSVVIG